jgi:hypothetical protein
MLQDTGAPGEEDTVFPVVDDALTLGALVEGYDQLAAELSAAPSG